MTRETCNCSTEIKAAAPRREIVRAFVAWGALRLLGGCGQRGSDGTAATAATDHGADAGAVPSERNPPNSADMGAAKGEQNPRGVPYREACTQPTAFVEVPDDGLRHGVASFHATGPGDWLLTGISASLFQASVPDTLLRLLRTLDRVHLGYPLTVLEHSLQTATRAQEAGADDDMVLAALLHHVGMAICAEGYAELGAAMVRGHVTDTSYRIIRHFPEYASRHYGAQTGEPTDLRERYRSEPFHASAVRLADEWERFAYDPAYPSLSLDAFEPLLRARFTSLPLHDPYPTQHDCIGR